MFSKKILTKNRFKLLREDFFNLTFVQGQKIKPHNKNQTIEHYHPLFALNNIFKVFNIFLDGLPTFCNVILFWPFLPCSFILKLIAIKKIFTSTSNLGVKFWPQHKPNCE